MTQITMTIDAPKRRCIIYDTEKAVEVSKKLDGLYVVDVVRGGITYQDTVHENHIDWLA